MICNGVVVFKGIGKRDGGKFTDSSGREITYDSSYVVNFDERNNSGEINQRKLKFPASNTYLYNKFASIEPYTQIYMECDVVFSQNSVKLVPMNVETQIPEEFEKEVD